MGELVEGLKVDGKQLFEVTVFLRAYALAEDADDAEDIIKENLFEIVTEEQRLVTQLATAENLDPAWRNTIPWATSGEDRTCQQILDGIVSRATDLDQMGLEL